MLLPIIILYMFIIYFANTIYHSGVHVYYNLRIFVILVIIIININIIAVFNGVELSVASTVHRWCRFCHTYRTRNYENHDRVDFLFFFIPRVRETADLERLSSRAAFVFLDLHSTRVRIPKTPRLILINLLLLFLR